MVISLFICVIHTVYIWSWLVTPSKNYTQNFFGSENCGDYMGATGRDLPAKLFATLYIMFANFDDKLYNIVENYA